MSIYANFDHVHENRLPLSRCYLDDVLTEEQFGSTVQYKIICFYLGIIHWINKKFHLLEVDGEQFRTDSAIHFSYFSFLDIL